jgi:Tfp pilus assembly protein PilF
MRTTCKLGVAAITVALVGYSGVCCAAEGGFLQMLWPWGKSEEKAALLNRPQPAPQIPTPVPTKQNYAAVQVAMGESFEKEGRIDSAENAYLAAIQNDPKLARAYHRLALLKAKNGGGEDTQRMFQQAIELDSDNADAVCDYGYWLYLQRDWGRATQQFNRALAIKPGMKRAHNNLGLLYGRTGRTEESLRHFELAGVGAAGAHANLGLVQLTEQQLPEAEASLRRALQIDPNAEMATTFLASVERINRAVGNSTVEIDRPASAANLASRPEAALLPEINVHRPASAAQQVAAAPPTRRQIQPSIILPAAATTDPESPIYEISDGWEERPITFAPRPAPEPLMLLPLAESPR